MLKKILGPLVKTREPVSTTSSGTLPVSPPVYRQILNSQNKDLAFHLLPKTELKALARFGEIARARLESAPEAARIPADGLDMFVVREFLTAYECDQLIALIDSDARPSTTLRPFGTTNPRTSETCRLTPNQPLVAEVERRITELLGLPASHSETAQGQRYLLGQQFRLHNDFFAGEQFYSEVVAEEGGQRTWTAMVFLDEPKAEPALNSKARGFGRPTTGRTGRCMPALRAVPGEGGIRAGKLGCVGE